MTNQTGRAAEYRAAAGLPVIACPNCGKIAAHWFPESLEAPGRFTCTSQIESPNS